MRKKLLRLIQLKFLLENLKDSKDIKVDLRILVKVLLKEMVKIKL